ncbi:hypothetical protein L195_g004512 [Trifolium pratense]|uniref:Uncharacterized protein n=1 Tax=Trifolium pratense TaxID=57577 RepID=A0A2K3NY82_TRIPR|nr:hypothetical protein L195_g004512 [Trifolium pratense]
MSLAVLTTEEAKPRHRNVVVVVAAAENADSEGFSSD